MARQSDRRRVLLVSPQFPPNTAVGANRGRHLAKHLPSHGWDPTVIAVDPHDYVEAIDKRLNALVPDGTDVRLVRAWPADVTRRFGLSDLGIRAFAGLKRQIMSELATRPPDLVFITGFPFYPMLLSGQIAAHGVPVVLDFQDPWVSAWGATQPPLSKAGVSHRLATWLEPRAVRPAAGIMSVSDTQNAQMRERYRWLTEDQMLGLPIGGDWSDFELAAGGGQGTNGDIFSITYAGALLPRAGPLFRQVFQAAAQLRADRPDLAARIRFRFFGTAAVTDRNAAPVVVPIAAAEGVADMVDETPYRIPYFDVLGEMARSSGQLIVGSDEVHYTASKIYPVLMAGPPFISLFHARSSSHDILSRAGGGIALAFADDAELAGMAPRIAQALARMVERPASLGQVDRTVVEPYTAHAIAGQAGAFFERLL